MLESHDLLHGHQFGFRRKRSTTSLLMTTVHDWAAGLNLSQTTHCLFLDMSKAFDSVPHETLLLNRSLRYFMTYLIEIIVPRYSYILQCIQNFKSYFSPIQVIIFSLSIKTKLYMILICSILTYCSPVWWAYLLVILTVWREFNAMLPNKYILSDYTNDRLINI